MKTVPQAPPRPSRRTALLYTALPLLLTTPSWAANTPEVRTTQEVLDLPKTTRSSPNTAGR
ncbi:MAG: hypothetical protein AAF488_09815 [Planctomycetota bacterium]